MKGPQGPGSRSKPHRAGAPGVPTGDRAWRGGHTLPELNRRPRTKNELKQELWRASDKIIITIAQAKFAGALTSGGGDGEKWTVQGCILETESLGLADALYTKLSYK